jgi:hypothetical protein
MELFHVKEKFINICRYEFVLNYLSKPTNTEKIKYIRQLYEFNEFNFKNTVFKDLLPVLKSKTIKMK